MRHVDSHHDADDKEDCEPLLEPDGEEEEVGMMGSEKSPREKKRRTRIIYAVSALVILIVGGCATAILLLKRKSSASSSAAPSLSPENTASIAPQVTGTALPIVVISSSPATNPPLESSTSALEDAAAVSPSSIGSQSGSSVKRTTTTQYAGSTPQRTEKAAKTAKSKTTQTDSEPSSTTIQNTPTSTPSVSSKPTTTAITAAAAKPTLPTSPTVDPTSSYWTKQYSGVITHFPGAASALACGDVYSSPSTQKFAALCHSLYDSSPSSSSSENENENRSPVCGPFVPGRKGLQGEWLDGTGGKDWVVVGGDGELNCVGTEEVRCHVPLTVDVSFGGVTVKGVMIVDRNQGLGPSPCSSGDLDVSDVVYRTLAKTTVGDANAGLGSELVGATWRWASTVDRRRKHQVLLH